MPKLISSKYNFLKLSDIRPIHPFPARMAPSIAYDEIPAANTRPLRILDPMVGSGTTAVVARAKGHSAIAFDTDPLAVLLSRAWSSDVSPKGTIELAADVLKEARKLRRHYRRGYARGTDKPTAAFINYWFDEENQCELRALSELISEIPDPGKRTLLWCGFSRLIITKSRGASLAMDLSHSRPHKVYSVAPIRPFDEFERAVRRVVGCSPFKGNSKRLPSAKVRESDARTLPLADCSIDVVITSPPYLNAIDYVRCSKFSLVWMGYSVGDLQSLRSTNIGTERGRSFSDEREYFEGLLQATGKRLADRYQSMFRGYILDLDGVLSETSRVLVPQGRAIFVVGDSTIRGTFVKNSEIIKRLAIRHGLTFKKKVTRELMSGRRYLPPPGTAGSDPGLSDRMRREVILHFVKPLERPR